MESVGEYGLSKSTAKTVDEAVVALDRELSARKFSVLWDLDIQAKLHEKGIQGGPQFRILEVCSAPRAKEALDADLRVGYFLPCKIVVYRQQDTTTVGLLRPQMLVSFFADERLGRLGEEVESALVEAIEAAC